VKPFVLWLTGLSGAGKTTKSREYAALLHQLGVNPLLIDGDDLRSGVSKDLDYSQHDRSKNTKRAGEIAILAAKSGISSIVSMISPLAKDRNEIRSKVESLGVTFVEIFVDYAANGSSEFNMGFVYETPTNPEITISR
jgi:adenylylsulfate kinase-like enzyme